MCFNYDVKVCKIFNKNKFIFRYSFEICYPQDFYIPPINLVLTIIYIF